MVLARDTQGILLQIRAMGISEKRDQEWVVNKISETAMTPLVLLGDIDGKNQKDE